jgi:hypothetical protein
LPFRRNPFSADQARERMPKPVTKTTTLMLSSRGWLKQSDADLKAIITKGKGKMPALEGKLTEAQIDQLLAYIRELPKK